MLGDILDIIFDKDIIKRRVYPMFYGYATFNLIMFILIVYIAIRISIR